MDPQAQTPPPVQNNPEPVQSDNMQAEQIEEQVKTLTAEAYKVLTDHHMLVQPGTTIDAVLRELGELDLADRLKAAQQAATDLHERRFGALER